MKIKYFLRGLGTGIIFTVLVLFPVYSYKMSDSKIIEKAKELGMEYSSDVEKESAKNVSETESDTREVQNTGDEDTKRDTSQETETTFPINTETTISQETVKVSITSGMNSEKVSQMLQMAGIIDNAEEFNTYLITNNLGRYLRTGEFEVHSGMSYEEIAEVLLKTQ